MTAVNPPEETKTETPATPPERPKLSRRERRARARAIVKQWEKQGLISPSRIKF